MAHDFADEITALALDQVKREREVVERVCEMSLVDPLGRGVRVDRYPDRITANLSADVPAGEIHEHDHARA